MTSLTAKQCGPIPNRSMDSAEAWSVTFTDVDWLHALFPGETHRCTHARDVETLMPILSDTQPAPIPAAQPSPAAVIEERRYLQRFDRSQVRVRVVRTWRIASGDLVTRICYEPWLGL